MCLCVLFERRNSVSAKKLTAQTSNTASKQTRVQCEKVPHDKAKTSALSSCVCVCWLVCRPCPCQSLWANSLQWKKSEFSVINCGSAHWSQFDSPWPACRPALLGTESSCLGLKSMNPAVSFNRCYTSASNCTFQRLKLSRCKDARDAPSKQKWSPWQRHEPSDLQTITFLWRCSDFAILIVLLILIFENFNLL